ncbi:unnamed protein product [Cyclocybe aegerita]|uniref:Uncharacterized protein n=1 Tax=Cyclocybe aegerita TaxID=1973307 RepID=A0A8S0Y0V2_CYCAE|nr:unnamed protein product [Cyclocybe aegerita]
MSSTVTTPTVQRGAAQTCPECLSSSLVLSGIAYGIVATLFFDCLRLLIQKKASLSSRRRLLFITYMSMMFLASTTAVVLGSISVMWPPGVGKIFSQHVFGPYVFALWGADGMMFILGALAMWSVVLYPPVTNGEYGFLHAYFPGRSPRVNHAYQHHPRKPGRISPPLAPKAYTTGAWRDLRDTESGPTTVIVELLITHVSVLSPLFVFHRVAQGTDAVTSIQTQDIRFQIEKPTDSANETNHRISTLRFTTSGGTESTA